MSFSTTLQEIKEALDHFGEKWVQTEGAGEHKDEEVGTNAPSMSTQAGKEALTRFRKQLGNGKLQFKQKEILANTKEVLLGLTKHTVIKAEGGEKDGQFFKLVTPPECDHVAANQKYRSDHPQFNQATQLVGQQDKGASLSQSGKDMHEVPLKKDLERMEDPEKASTSKLAKDFERIEDLM